MAEYSHKTKELLDRMCRVATRQEYIFDKPKIRNLVKQSYELFGFAVPHVEWCVDITDGRFSAASAWSAWSARSARSARSAWLAWSASSARSASSAWLAWSASSARSASSAWLASSAWSARSARSARSASSAWSASSARSARSASSAWLASSATDYDGGEFIYSFEYAQANPHKINDNDRVFLKASELFLQLKEAGAGYWAEKNGILFICPNAIVQQNTQQQFHSDTKPAISWKDGLSVYYLHGFCLEKELWQKIVSNKMSFADIMQIQNADIHAIALKYNPLSMLDAGAMLVDKSERNNELYLIENTEINIFLDEPKIWFLKMLCPTGRTFVEGVPPDYAAKHPKADHCQAFLLGITPNQYRNLAVEG